MKKYVTPQWYSIFPIVLFSIPAFIILGFLEGDIVYQLVKFAKIYPIFIVLYLFSIFSSRAVIDLFGTFIYVTCMLFSNVYVFVSVIKKNEFFFLIIAVYVLSCTISIIMGYRNQKEKFKKYFKFFLKKKYFDHKKATVKFRGMWFYHNLKEYKGENRFFSFQRFSSPVLLVIIMIISLFVGDMNNQYMTRGIITCYLLGILSVFIFDGYGDFLFRFLFYITWEKKYGKKLKIRL
ncbi:MAG TPA: hypothetical protein PLH15_02010 [Spirochaetota bacterium]|nr:hypothetical protein [Spirochaetota bacterium]HQO21619.1 hypothetical protein [Spirochaetota bacterium]HQQ22599.1 hypothetical protein [Spirochaetota bacterium]